MYKAYPQIYYLFLLFIFPVISAHAAEGREEGETEVGTNNQNNVALGFCLVLFGATLSTLGSMILYLDNLIKFLPFIKKDVKLSTSKPFLASSLSFSCGVLMITIFNSVLPEGLEAFHKSNLFGEFAGLAASLYFVFCTCLIISVKYLTKRRRMNKDIECFPPMEIQHCTNRISLPRSSYKSKLSQQEMINLKRDSNSISDFMPIHNEYFDKGSNKIGYEIALGIAIHNFPEGVLTFVATYQSVKGGLLFGLALALHKFPEGIMIGVPIFTSTGSKLKACLITAATSFIPQLMGAGFAYAMFNIYWNDIIGGLLFLLASAILISTLLSGMLPLARSYDEEDKYSTTWMSLGIIVFVFLTSVISEK